MTIEETTQATDLVEIHADRVIKELEAIPSEDAVRAIAFANTTRGRAELVEMCETALPYEQIADQLIWSGNLDRNDPAAAGERAAREDNARMDALTQDEAAELAETIEAERAKAIRGVCVTDEEMQEERTLLIENLRSELVVLHQMYTEQADELIEWRDRALKNRAQILALQHNHKET